MEIVVGESACYCPLTFFFENGIALMRLLELRGNLGAAYSHPEKEF